MGDFGTTLRYRNDWSPRIVIQNSLFETSPLDYLRGQKENGLIGKYAELILARIVNGNITDMDGELPDITLDAGDQRVYIESKAARYTNNGKYVTPSQNKKNVSRRGFFVKRSQIYKSLALELSEERTQTYTAFVDYDLRGGENMTVETYIKEHPNAFKKLSDYREMEKLHRELQNTLIIKGIVLLPTWALYEMWNRNIIRARSVTGKFKPGQKFRGEVVPVAQYSEHSHTDHMIETLRAFGVPEHQHEISGLGKPGEKISLTSFGHRFLPATEVECQMAD